jgi:hypothetical protein
MAAATPQQRPLREATGAERRTFLELLGREGGSKALHEHMEGLRLDGVDVAGLRCPDADPHAGRMTPLGVLVRLVRARAVCEGDAAEKVSVLRAMGQDPNQRSPHDESLPAVTACYHGQIRILRALLEQPRDDGWSPPSDPMARQAER